MSVYRPEVGDRVKAAGDGVVEIDVLAIDGPAFWGSYYDFPLDRACRNTFDLDADWVKVTPRPELPDLPDMWAVVLDAFTTPPLYASIRSALKFRPDAIAFVRYVPDLDSIVWADDLDGGAS